MPLPIPAEPTAQTAFIFLVFIIFVAVVYRLFRLAFSAAVSAAVGFSFPWLNAFLKFGLPITADLRTSLIFAAAAVALFLAYEFAHYVIAFLKMITWPIRTYFHNKDKERVKKLEKEVDELERKK